MVWEKLVAWMAIYGKRGVFYFLVLCMLGGVFYFPREYTDRFFTSGMIWLCGVGALFGCICFLFVRSDFRLPLVAVYGAVLILVYGIYAVCIDTFSWQQFAFLWGLWLIAVSFSMSEKIGSIERICQIITVIAFVEALWGLGQGLGWLPVYSTHFPVTGTFDNPAGLSTFLALCFPFVLYFVFFCSGWRRIGGFVVAGLLSICVWFSGSRTGILALAIVGLLMPILYFWPNVKRRKRWFVAMGIVWLLLLAGLYGMKKDSADGRLLIWRCTWEMICERPVLGHGPSRFGGTYMPFQARYLEEHGDSREQWLAGNVKHPFNEYLRILAEYGWGGLALVVFGVILLLQGKKSEEQTDLIAKMSLLAVAVCACFSYPLNYPAVLAVVVLVLGLLMRQGKIYTLRRKWRIVGLGMAGGLLIFTFFWKGMEHRWYCLSHETLNGESGVLEDYRRLYRFMRENPLFLYNYGMELYMRERWTESTDVLLQCSRQLNDTDVQMVLAENYLQIKDSLRAERCFLLASQMYPALFRPPYRLVKLYNAQGRAMEARKWAEEILNKPVKIPSPIVNKIRKEMQQFLIPTNDRIEQKNIQMCNERILRTSSEHLLLFHIAYLFIFATINKKYKDDE